MDNRIIKDIRYYEEKPNDYQGKFDGILGNVYISSPDTKYIGQRIARKLNEFGFISGEFDHIYINLSTKLNDNEIGENDMFLDNRIKYLNYGIKPSDFNMLSDKDKDLKIKMISFQVLKWIYNNDNSKIQLINSVNDLIDKYDKQLTINYKAKESNNYKIDLSFRIRPNNDKSELIVEYLNKKDNITLFCVLELLDYDDLYSLVDNVTIKNDLIIFQPKKSYQADFISKRYANPLRQIEVSKMIKK